MHQINGAGPLLVSPASIFPGDPVTVNWLVSIPPSCVGMRFTIDRDGAVDRWVWLRGPEVFYPGESTTYVLTAHMGDLSRQLGTGGVEVLPRPLPRVDGRPYVFITSNDQVALFVQAVGEPDAIVRIANDVQLDLSGRSDIVIERGVQIIGGRSSTERGPKLYTRTFPYRLFLVGTDYATGDSVRITGLRIEGPQDGIAGEDTPGSDGITVRNSVDVEIDNNEIYGWRGTAVSINDLGRDPDGRDRGDRLKHPRVESMEAFSVRVHDNFIHHNQHCGTLGYGVSVDDGAYVLIARNVFDYNRHAITAGGAQANGYWAQSNLVLEHGGINNCALNQNTHMFDVHGTDSYAGCCWGAGYYCGAAGEHFWFRYNTILYDSGTAIKLRGRPAMKSLAEYNVFKHEDEWGDCEFDGALGQTEPHENFSHANDTLGREWDEMKSGRRCDFDGDGLLDDFIASGANWWYYSTPGASWRFLRDAWTTPSDLTLGHFNGDPYCDVRDNTNGFVHLTPPGPELHGRRLQSSDGALHLVLDGKRYLIPDSATYFNLFKDMSRIEPFDVSAIPNGGTLSSYARLARPGDLPPGSPITPVYLIASDRKHWIPNSEAMTFYNFATNRIGSLPLAVVDLIVRGGDLTTIGVRGVPVPDLQGLDVFEATAALSAVGLARGMVRYTADCENVGKVVWHFPAAGTFAPAGAAVRLTVGTEPPTECN